MIMNIRPRSSSPRAAWARSGWRSAASWRPLIKYNCKVIDIHQDDKSVTATYIDSRTGGAPQKVTADWCVCTIPASVLSQIPMNVSAKKKAAINAIPYGAGLKIGPADEAPLLGRG